MSGTPEAILSALYEEKNGRRWFVGHRLRECGDHDTTGDRAWCSACSEWCYETVPCRGCEIPALRAEMERLTGNRDALAEVLTEWLAFVHDDVIAVEGRSIRDLRERSERALAGFAQPHEFCADLRWVGKATAAEAEVERLTAERDELRQTVSEGHEALTAALQTRHMRAEAAEARVVELEAERDALIAEVRELRG